MMGDARERGGWQNEYVITYASVGACCGQQIMHKEPSSTTGHSLPQDG